MVEAQISRSARDVVALRLVQIGAVAIVLAALPYKSFDLDRFFVVKELVLHGTAVLAALFCLAGRRQLSLDAVDVCLAAFLILSGVSTAFSINWWLATRALSISISGILIYWVAATLKRAGLQRALVSALAIGAVIGAITALVQAYGGATTEYFSLNRAPGGTFGNRNFMAHLAAIGTPAVVLAALSARSRLGFFIGSLGSVILAAALVLSRSRAAWLALIAAAVVIAGIALLLRVSISGGKTWSRLRLLAVAAGAGALGAAFIPNRLEWKSESPYLDSVVGVVNYKEGSGAGRLAQYTNSLQMSVTHPLLGVGPGNWAVAYPKYAASGDQSLAGDPGMTDNPWPSSDWVAFVSERGIIATGFLLLALVGLALSGLRELRQAAGDQERTAAALMLLGTIVATIVVGMFDAVLLLAVPAMYFWALAGALAPSTEGKRTISAGVHEFGPVLLVLFGLLSVARSSFQIASMDTYSASSRISAIVSASRMDPGSYRIHMRLAESYIGRGDCDAAVNQARAARRLFPNAGEPRTILHRCGAR